MADGPMESLCDASGGPAVRDTLERIGDKWTLLVIGMLDSGPRRFTALRDSVPGISQRMLTRTLRHLERDGLVSRVAHPEAPPRVEYSLTPLGERLLPPVLALAQWARASEPEIVRHRAAYDERQPR